jgi:twitching motility protein PilT
MPSGPTMQPAIIWFTRLGIDQGIFTVRQAWAVRMRLGEDADLVDFAQHMLDYGHVPEDRIEALEKIAGLALVKAQQGAPSADPFDSSSIALPGDSSSAAPASPASSSTSARSSAAQPSSAYEAPAKFAAEPEAVSAAESSRHELAGDFPFHLLASLSDPEMANRLRDLLRSLARGGASDLHLSAGSRPFIRRQRVLTPLCDRVLGPDEALRLNTALLAPHQRQIFAERQDFDYALALDASSRFRVNLMMHKGGAAGSYRIVAAKIPKLNSLGLRNLDSVRKMLSYHNGLILVTGPVGAGKTTTLAALVAELNETREDHIISVEDPIEIVQVSQGCNVTQREVGPHTKSFATALKGALREDPDVIVIGELRDLETIEMAVTASETGHLVIGTMHTSDAATTLNRILDVFPPSQQSQIRASVSESLRGIICQRLLPSTDGELVLASEILVGNAAVSSLVREGKMIGLRNVLETGQREGMCLMENTVFTLYTEGRISAATARDHIPNRVLRARITG